jgi:hypothetical protein
MMETKKEQATVNEIIEVISKLILKASINKYNNKDGDENVKDSGNILSCEYCGAGRRRL